MRAREQQVFLIFREEWMLSSETPHQFPRMMVDTVPWLPYNKQVIKRTLCKTSTWHAVSSIPCPVSSSCTLVKVKSVSWTAKPWISSWQCLRWCVTSVMKIHLRMPVLSEGKSTFNSNFGRKKIPAIFCFITFWHELLFAHPLQKNPGVLRLWDQKPDNLWKCYSWRNGTYPKQRGTAIWQTRRWKSPLMNIVVSILLPGKESNFLGAWRNR